MKQEQITYTLILHQIRKKLRLTLMEYCLADSIYHLSNNPESVVKGWCFATKETIANMLGTTPQTIFDNIKKLIDKKLVEKHPETRHLKTTKKWYENVVLVKASAEYQETLHPIKKLDSGVSRKYIGTIKKLDTYNNKYNNKYNNGVNKDLEFYEKKTAEFKRRSK